MSSASTPALSVVVPLRDEVTRLPWAIERLRGFMRVHRSAEALFVVDPGTVDGTSDMLAGFAEDEPWIRTLRADRSGKGAAIAHGARHARGSVVITADVDLAVDPSEFPKLETVATGGVVAVASRSKPGAVRIGEPVWRYLVGRGFNLAVRTMVLPGMSDTQCGFKAFPREWVTEILGDLRAAGWVFDVELLARARAAGFPICEVPVRWTYSPGSRLRPVRHTPGIVGELWGVRRRFGRVGVREHLPAPPAVSPAADEQASDPAARLS